MADSKYILHELLAFIVVKLFYLCAGIPVPTVKLLIKELKEVTDDWKLFGVSLGVPVKKLKAIKLDDPHGGVENWKLEMFHFWLRLKSDASWKDVVKALELNDYGRLAARVRKTYITLDRSAGKMLLHCYYITGCHAMLFTEKEKFELEVLADASVVLKLRDVESSFARMLSRFGSILKNCDDELIEARRFLNRASGSREFSGCNDIDELLDKLCLGNYIDPFNLYQLKSLLTNIKFEKEALGKIIEEYEKEKQAFLESTKVCEFQQAIVAKVEPILQQGEVQVTIKILKKMKCAKLTLADIENLALEGFEESQQYMVHMHAKPGSVIISWVFPEEHSCELEKSVRKNAAKFKNAGVDEVTVDGKTVFPLEEVRI